MIRQTCVAVTAIACIAGSGCEDLPGTKRQQGAVIGGAGGAIAGAAIAKGNPLLGALLGGALGAGGGYLIGVQMEKEKNNLSGAQSSIQTAQSNPATAEQARSASTADVNGDGYVTMDEVIAMDKAGFNDDEMLNRLRASNQVFFLSQEQKDFLVNNGVSRNVVNQMESINADRRNQLMAEHNDNGRAGEVIGSPR